jgi:hypothetical protein
LPRALAPKNLSKQLRERWWRFRCAHAGRRSSCIPRYRGAHCARPDNYVQPGNDTIGNGADREGDLHAAFTGAMLGYGRAILYVLSLAHAEATSSNIVTSRRYARAQVRDAAQTNWQLLPMKLGAVVIGVSGAPCTADYRMHRVGLRVSIMVRKMHK